MASSSEILKEEFPPNIIMKDCNTFFCKCCSCILVGLGCMKQHVAGKRHKKEMQRIGIVIPPPKNQVVEADIKPIETTSSSKLPCGIIESKEKWNSFHCTYCSCDLGAGDLNLHVGGKRHTKKANQVALENFISKSGGRNISKTEYTTSCEERNDAKPTKYDKVTEEGIEETSLETSDSVMPTSDRNVLAKASPKSDASLSAVTEVNASIKALPETNMYVESTPQTNTLVKTTVQTNVFCETTLETNTFVELTSQRNSSERSFPQTNASLKASAQTDNSLKTTATPTKPSVKISLKTGISEKPASQTNDLVKTASQRNAVEKIPQSNESARVNSKTDASGKTTSQVTASMKVTPQNNSSIKTASQTNASVKDTRQTKVKAVPQTNASVKTTSETKIKAVLQTNSSGKTTPHANVSVKAVPQTDVSVKDIPQKASLKADPQTATSIKSTSLQTSPQSRTSLNEYFATVSNPIVGLNYVVETQMPNDQSIFQCKLCNVSGDTCVMKDHINATKHHLEYLRTVDPIKAAEVRALKDTERNQKILEHVTELERKKGRGTILVKTAETKTITGDGSDKDDSEIIDTTAKKSLNYASDDDDTEESIQIVAQEFLTKEVIRNAQKKDAKTSKIIKELMDDVPNSSYIMHDDILYEKRNGKYRVVVAQAMKQAIYESYHFSLCRKTPGAVTYINNSYSWFGINEDITKFAKQCYVCQIRKLRQLSDGEAIPILVRRGQGKKASSPIKRGFNDLTSEEIEGTQRWDPDTIKLIADIENGLETSKHIVYANILYCLDETGQYKIVVSPQMKKLIFEKNHSMLCWKSTERPPVINAITQVYFWQRMLEEVKLFAVKCKKCRINIPVKRISDQKISVPASTKVSKKTTEKARDEATKDEPKEKSKKSSTKDKLKQKARDEPKEKSSRNTSWDKTKSLKPPIVEQDILTKDMIRDAQKKDTNTSKIIKLLMDGVPSSSYILYEGVLFQEKNGKYLTMVADKMKQAIYEKCHSSLCSRYTGRSSQRDGTRYINRHFSWPAMSQDIYIFVKNCHVCQVRTLRTKSFSRLSSEERHNNKVIISASRSAFNDLTDDEISAAQRKDPDTLKILHQIEDGSHISRHILYEDILYCQDGHGDYKVAITPEMKGTIYQNNHFLLCWESTVWQSTVDMIAQVYLWSRIHEDIRDLMESCQICKREFPEQSYIDPMAYTTTMPDGDKTSVNLMEQYPPAYSDPAYYSQFQQYQSNYPVQSMDPYFVADSAAYPYNAYSQYWNTSPDAIVAYPTLSSGTNYWENSVPDVKEQGYLLNSGKRSANDDINSPDIKEDSLDSYSQRKRRRFDLECEYPSSQSDSDHLSSFEAPIQLDQSITLSASQFQHSPHPLAGSHSELGKPIEAEGSSNTLGFTITNADDAEVTLDIINSLMHIYLKYQLKKLHGPVQKLLQESFKEEDNNTMTLLGENAVSDTSDVTDTDTNELFVRLPRLNKSKKAEVKPATVCSVKTANESFPKPSFGQHPQSTYASSSSTIFKADKSCNVSANSSRKNDMNLSFGKESDSPKTNFFPSQSHGIDDVVNPHSPQNDDDIDGFPMTTDPTDKVSSKWDDDIDGKPLITESSENTEHTPDSIDSVSKKRKTSVDHGNSPVRSTRNPSLHKPLRNKDDDIDGVPLGFRTSSSLNKSQLDSKAFPLASKPSGSSNKPESSSNDNKDSHFLKPDSTKIFKKPPDDWDKNANKAQTVKNNSFAKPKSNWDEKVDDEVPETRALSDKYPNWKKGGIQGGTSFYNSPLYNKASEGETSSSSSAPVIDLFKRYRRVQL